jgi:ribonuclease HII
MSEMHKEYPGYGWDSNFGYATKKHYEGISKLGITPIHRLTFLKKEMPEIEMGFL